MLAISSYFVENNSDNYIAQIRFCFLLDQLLDIIILSNDLQNPK